MNSPNSRLVRPSAVRLLHSSGPATSALPLFEEVRERPDQVPSSTVFHLVGAAAVEVLAGGVRLDGVPAPGGVLELDVLESRENSFAHLVVVRPDGNCEVRGVFLLREFAVSLPG